MNRCPWCLGPKESSDLMALCPKCARELGRDLASELGRTAKKGEIITINGVWSVNPAGEDDDA